MSNSIGNVFFPAFPAPHPEASQPRGPGARPELTRVPWVPPRFPREFHCGEGTGGSASNTHRTQPGLTRTLPGRKRRHKRSGATPQTPLGSGGAGVASTPGPAGAATPSPGPAARRSAERPGLRTAPAPPGARRHSQRVPADVHHQLQGGVAVLGGLAPRAAQVVHGRLPLPSLLPPRLPPSGAAAKRRRRRPAPPRAFRTRTGPDTARPRRSEPGRQRLPGGGAGAVRAPELRL